MNARVIVGGRLHFGFRNLCLNEKYIYGGVGMAIENPKISLVAETADRIICEDDRLTMYAEKAVEMLGVKGVKIQIEEEIPEHIGLGSGTQMALSVYTAVSRVYCIDSNIREISPKLGRGKRSGIGVSAFEKGGFCIDEGHKNAPGHVESLKYGEWKIPAERYTSKIPEEWSFVVAMIEAIPGYSGEMEENLIRKVMLNAKNEIANKIDNVITNKLLPSIDRSDCKGFGSAISEISWLNGLWYEKYQNGIYRPPIGNIIEILQEDNRIFGMGQSSWGPSLYCITVKDHENEIRKKVHQVLNECDIEGKVIATSARNKGAEVKLIK